MSTNEDAAPAATAASDEGRADAIDTIRERWHDLRPEMDTSPMGTIGRVIRSARHVAILSDEVLSHFGITRGEFDVLSAVRRSVVARTASDLARELVTSNAAITKRMVQLESLGLAARERGTEDRRVVQIVLTDAGIACIDAAFPAQLDLERAIESVLSPAQRVEFENALRGLLGELERRSLA